MPLLLPPLPLCLLLFLYLGLSYAVAPRELSVTGTSACYEQIEQSNCFPAATVYAKMQPDAAVQQNFSVDGGNLPDWSLNLRLQRLSSEFSA